MKNNIFVCMLVITAISFAQEKMITKNGKVTFDASVPSFEEVTAKSDVATCVLNPKSGQIACLVLIKGFRFNVALMEEHFNENYIESSKYPKATFKGKIENFDVLALTDTVKDYKIKGTLELHGKSKEITTTASIRKTDGGIEIISDFSINTEDYAISIPAVVKNKISNKVDIRSEFTVK